MDYFGIFSTIFKYVFIAVVYLFIFNILKDILYYFKNESKTRTATVKIYYDGRSDSFKFKHAFTIGRAADNDYVISDNRVSKHHIQIKEDAVGYRLSDLNSANGTLLNGSAVKEAHLSNGDVIELPGVEIKFEEHNDR